MRRINRRNLLASAGAIGLAGSVVQAASLSPTTSTIAALYEEWRQTWEWMNAASADGVDLPEDQMSAALDQTYAAEWAIVRHPADTVADISIKADLVSALAERNRTAGVRLDGVLEALSRSLADDLRRYAERTA